MKIIPILTEKTLSEAKEGHYTFWVGDLDKTKAKKVIEKIFDVHVKEIKTMNYKKGQKRTLKGQIQRIPARKKVIVKLAGGEKIDLFEEKKKK